MPAAGRHPLLLACALSVVAAARPLPAQAIDTARALGGLRDLRTACAADAGALWGRSLCGPVALVDWRSRLVVANDTIPGRAFVPYGDAFVGVLPADQQIANTSFAWGGRPWAMVVLGLPKDRFARAALLAHESFHREQAALGFPAVTPASAHLDERAGRTWLRLELRALAAALVATDDGAARRHALDAVAFRARRHAGHPGADTLEAQLERYEGLAEYTGQTLAMRLTGDGPARVARWLRTFEAETPTYTRSFAYATGPAIGVLLDRWDPAWRAAAPREPSIAARLARTLGGVTATLARDAERRARGYDAATVMREEAERDAERTRRLAAYRARLVDGPTLVLTQRELGTAFDPNALVPAGRLGTVYPTGTFTAPWGKLTVTEGGALVSPDMARVSVKAPASAPNGSRVEGDGWVLEVAEGWGVVPDSARGGGFVVAKRP